MRALETTRQSPRWLGARVGRSNAKSFEYCEFFLQLVQFGQVSSTRLNAFESKGGVVDHNNVALKEGLVIK